MKEYIWLFPLIFIFHDMEEIIGLRIWINNNSDRINHKYPRIHKMVKDFSTEAFTVAVFEELIVCIILCIATSFFNNHVVWGMWLGAFIACTVHFAIHITQTILFRSYIPAVLTSIFSMPPSIWIIFRVLSHFSSLVADMYPYMILGFLLVIINLVFAHKLMSAFTKYSNLKTDHKEGNFGQDNHPEYTQTILHWIKIMGK